MELIVLLVLIAAALGGFFWRRAKQPAKSSGKETVAIKTVEDLDPGDGVRFWDDQIYLVDTVLDCTEQLGDRTTRWKWVFLSDGRLLEVAPDGNVLYDRPEVIHQGAPDFERLTQDGGVLKSFEEKVRQGVSGLEPVHFHHGTASYQVKSTGTFLAEPRGKRLANDAWRDISPKADNNVYFEMVSSAGAPVLGIWTTHIALHAGQPLKESDVASIYPKGREASTH